MAIAEQDYFFYHKGQCIEVGGRLFLALEQNPLFQIFEGDEIPFDPGTCLWTPIYTNPQTIPQGPCGYLISTEDANRGLPGVQSAGERKTRSTFPSLFQS